MSLDGSTKKILNTLLIIVAAAWGLFQIYTGGFGILSGLQQRIVHVGFALIFVYIQQLTTSKEKRPKLLTSQIIVVLFLLLSVISTMYGMINGSVAIGVGAGKYSLPDIIVGIITTVLIADAVRRKIGWPLTIIMLTFLAYARWGYILPGFLGHSGYSWSRIISHTYLSYEGMYGVAIGASATYIALFILFGDALQVTGSGDLFSIISQGLFGRFRGGPAKIAVVASCFFGSISGSAAANVAGTGNFTIPLMKRNKFTPVFAGAVEAAASTGGQLMPPVMGVAAFLIAEYLSIPYVEVIKSALFPALLYYIGVFWAVDLYSIQHGLKGLDKSELPKVVPVMKKGWPLLIPLIALLYLLIIVRTSAMKAAFWAIVILFVIALVTRYKKLGRKEIVEFFISSADSLVAVALACGAAGMVIGVFSLTGLGVKFSTILLTFSGGKLIVLLFLTMVASLILGMGLPTVSAYIVLATLIAPSIIELGIIPIAAHLFVFYFGMLSNLTPPVAIAAYTAAGIANSNPLQTGIQAVKIALPGFILPYVFVYSPAMLLVGSSGPEIFMSIITAFLGIGGLGFSIYGQFGWRRLAMWQRVIIFFGAIMMIIDNIITSLIGFAIIAIILGMNCIFERKQKIYNDKKEKVL